MGHKAIVIFDLENLENMKADPAEFVRRLEIVIVTHARLGGSVSVGGATIANVVWSGHANQSPTLRFNDFQAVAVETPVRTKRKLP